MLTQYAHQAIRESSEMFLITHDGSDSPTCEPHVHDYFEITFVTKGVVKLFLAGHNFALTEGTLVLIRPNDIHMKQSEEGSCHINIAFLDKVFHDAFSYLRILEQKDLLLNSPIISPLLLCPPDFASLHSAIRQLSWNYTSNDENLNVRLRILVMDILANHFITLKDPNIPISGPHWLNQYLQQFNTPDNLTKGISFFQENIPVSYGYLCRLFKKHYGLTITEYVNSSRLTFAANMLAFSDKEIIDLCEEAGFSSLSHFYHLFKSKYHVTPKEYRVASQKKEVLKLTIHE